MSRKREEQEDWGNAGWIECNQWWIKIVETRMVSKNKKHGCPGRLGKEGK